MKETQEKFSKIYDDYNAKIYRFIYLKVSSQEIAEDLSSDVFTRLWEALQEQIRNSKFEIRNFQAYMYQIARNVVADHYKKKNIKTVSVDENFEIVDSENPVEEKAMVNMEMDRVQKALAGLHSDYQDLIIWRYLDELSFSEIAQITGKTEDTVRVGLHRALQALKQRLEVA